MIDAETFGAYLALQELSEATIRAYRPLFVRWCDYATAAGRDPFRPDPLTVRAWAAKLPGTRALVAQARAMIGHLCTALEVDDVSAAIPLPRQPQRPARALEPDAARALVAAAHRSGLAGTAVLVGLYTAARRSEIASLAWRRVDFASGQLTLERSKVRDLHTVPLHPVLASHLEDRHVPGELWVFPGRHGGHVAPATVWRWVLEVADAAGIGKVTPHQLRHTALTVANDATGDLRAVQTLAGHTDPAVTARYTRSSAGAMRRAVGALDY